MGDGGVHVGGLYRHFKGNTYRVIAVGHDSDTLKPVVVYQGQYDSDEFGPNPIWVRPLQSFVEILERDGQTIPRFAYVEEGS
jgi:hypothetical protein